MPRRIKVNSSLPPRILILATLAIGALTVGPSSNAAQDVQALKQTDDRYKADILLVVAHPDDEGAATPYSGPRHR